MIAFGILPTVSAKFIISFVENRFKQESSVQLELRLQQSDAMAEEIARIYDVDLNDPETYKFRVIDKMRYQSRQTGRQISLSRISADYKDLLMAGTLFYAARAHSGRIANAFDELVVENGNFCLNLTDVEPEDRTWASVRDLFVDPDDQLRRQYEAGRRKGIQDVLDRLQGDVPLLLHTQNSINHFGLERFGYDNGQRFRVPTRLVGVAVDYSYPSEQTDPTVQIIIDRL